MTVELTANLSLTTEEQSLLTMHSVLNVLNVVMAELNGLRDTVGEHPALEEAEDVVVDIARDLRDAKLAVSHVRAAESLTSRLTDLVDRAVADTPGAADSTEVRESMENLASVFEIFRVRAQELAARAPNPEAWVELDIGELKHNFLEVFAAIERNSKGDYRIVYNLAAHEEGNYYVDFEISSFRGSVIRMPPELQDVMRDLIANARKYTAPGGRIAAGLNETEERLRFVVEDTGCGIPREEIPKVVSFGYRGSNVQDHPTRGGGFGLTKAFYVTRRRGGRMWVESEPDRGTRIEIVIPQHS